MTEVDHAAEELIRTRLLKARPDDGFVGEEGSSDTSDSEVAWVVDPIDGTVNFLYGIPQYAISIAASGRRRGRRGGRGRRGEGETFTATRGEGAHLDGRPIAVHVVPLGQRLVITGFSYERDTRMAQAAAVHELLGRVRDVRRLGSAALDLCYVGCGRADAYVEPQRVGPGRRRAGRRGVRGASGGASRGRRQAVSSPRQRAVSTSSSPLSRTAASWRTDREYPGSSPCWAGCDSEFDAVSCETGDTIRNGRAPAPSDGAQSAATNASQRAWPGLL